MGKKKLKKKNISTTVLAVSFSFIPCMLEDISTACFWAINDAFICPINSLHAILALNFCLVSVHSLEPTNTYNKISSKISAYAQFSWKSELVKSVMHDTSLGSAHLIRKLWIFDHLVFLQSQNYFCWEVLLKIIYFQCSCLRILLVVFGLEKGGSKELRRTEKGLLSSREVSSQ